MSNCCSRCVQQWPSAAASLLTATDPVSAAEECTHAIPRPRKYPEPASEPPYGIAGIGKAAVNEFAKLGAQVFTCSRDQSELDEALQPHKARNLPVSGCQADVTDSAAAEHMISEALKFFGGVAPSRASTPHIPTYTIIRIHKPCMPPPYIQQTHGITHRGHAEKHTHTQLPLVPHFHLQQVNRELRSCRCNHDRDHPWVTPHRITPAPEGPRVRNVPRSTWYRHRGMQIHRTWLELSPWPSAVHRNSQVGTETPAAPPPCVRQHGNPIR